MDLLRKMLLHVAHRCLRFRGSIPLTAFQSRGCRPRSCSTAPRSQNTTPHLQSWLSWQQHLFRAGVLGNSPSFLCHHLCQAVCSEVGAGCSCPSWLMKKGRKQKGLRRTSPPTTAKEEVSTTAPLCHTRCAASPPAVTAARPCLARPAPGPYLTRARLPYVRAEAGPAPLRGWRRR